MADLAERRTLRFWPWLVMCAAGVLLFGLLAWFVGIIALEARTTTARIVAIIFFAGLATLAVYSLVSLRIRTVLGPTGSTARSAFSRSDVPWSEVERLDVTHSLPGWAVRAWTAGGETSILYMCHDTHGRQRVPRTYDRPPAEAPRAVQRGYDTIERYWQASRCSAASMPEVVDDRG